MKEFWKWMTGFLVAIVVLTAVAPYFVNEPLRKYVEKEMNSRLKGYSVQIRKFSLNPLQFSVDLQNIIVHQKANPEPPIAEIRRIHAGLHWRDLLRAHVVADASIDDPKIYIDLTKLKAEVKRPAAEKEAWQHTLQAIYPVQINEFHIRNGEVTYVPSADIEPLRVTGIMCVAHNIKNVKSPNRIYPSQVYLEAVLLDSAKITIEGEADFLLVPFIGIRADMDLKGLNLAGLKQFAESHNVSVSKGTLSATGAVEISPKGKKFMLKYLTLSDAAIDFIYTGPPTGAEKQRGKQAKEKAKEKAKEAVDKPGLLITAMRVRIERSRFGMVNKAANPDYQVYINNLDLEIDNFSNRFSEGPANLYLKGQFMGSGDTTVSGAFRPEDKGPDFNIAIAIKDTQMPAMNNLFRAYGNFDVSAGLFSVYSELTVKNNNVSGYVKPIFKDLKVYDRRTDKEKSEFRKLYEKIAGGIVNLLENRPREEVATETSISGRIENPEASTWETVANLIRNAFFQAILPGFEKNIK